MARLHRTKAVNVLTFEEKTRFAHFFTLLVEIDLRLPKSAKIKTRKRATQKIKHKPIKQEPCYIKCPAMCCSSRTAQRDLFLESFTRIFSCRIIQFTLGYCNARYYSFIANTGHVLHQ
jgi:hypothetical protein